ncbi:Hsp20/alpha crystallin family protein [Haloferacaceae archaeon DSL9]
MTPTQLAGRDERFLRRYEYADHWVIAADLPIAEDVDVDVLGKTVILVVDHGDRVQETEFELPGAATSIDVQNGVLTIRVEK